MASESSAKDGSKTFKGNASAPPLVLARADSTKDERDEGRSGVVGREVRVRELDRWRAEGRALADIAEACDSIWVNGRDKKL